MEKVANGFDFESYGSASELDPLDAALLEMARKVTARAYAPYSRFRVGAVARLSNGEILTGTNQENASFPAGICAERTLLSAISSLYPDVPIDTIALSYRSDLVPSDHPISPCGICRQSLCEYEARFKKPIRLIMGGSAGKVYIIPNSGLLLPLRFSPEDLGK